MGYFGNFRFLYEMFDNVGGFGSLGGTATGTSLGSSNIGGLQWDQNVANLLQGQAITDSFPYSIPSYSIEIAENGKYIVSLVNKEASEPLKEPEIKVIEIEIVEIKKGRKFKEIV